MILFDRSWWIPDLETHLPQWMEQNNRRVDGRLTYQYEKYEAALGHCPRRRVAVDVGAHVGLWSYWMARDFGQLHAFEPHADHHHIWQANLYGVPNATIYRMALGKSAGSVTLIPGVKSSGDARIHPALSGAIEMRTLDSVGLTDVDFLKIDCEGFEHFVLEGAVETIERSRPTIIVEQKPGHAQRYGLKEAQAIEFLEGLGYYCRWQGSGDYVMTTREAM